MSRTFKLVLLAAILSAAVWGGSSLGRNANRIKLAARAVKDPEQAVKDNIIVLNADVEYGRPNGRALLLDVMRPSDSIKRPALILIHGGGWQSGSKEQMRQLAAGAAQMGYVCFAVNYRLASTSNNKWPAQIDDVQLAVRWIRANAAKYRIIPERIGAIGISAGGHLAALLGTMGTRSTSDPKLVGYSSKVQCVVDLFGPADFTDRSESGAAWQRAAALYNLFGRTPVEAPDIYRLASPVEHVSRSSAPFLIFHGTKDPLVPIEQSERLCARLKNNGVDAKLVKMEGVGHELGNQRQLLLVIFQTQQFLRKHLED